MNQTKNFLPNMQKVLIPLDKSDASERAIKFAACLLAPLSNKIVDEIILLHVLGISFLEKMATHIDLRVSALKDSPLFKRLAQEYINKEIAPFLDEREAFLHKAGIKCKVKKEVIEGDPTKEIVNYAQQNNIYTIMMGRRRRSALKERMLGSCSYAVAHRPGHHTDYIVGLEEVSLESCPIPKILVPFDGSDYAHQALREAIGLVLSFPQGVIKLTVVYVLESAYAEQLEAIEEANLILEKARKELIGDGVSDSIVTTELRYGDPAEEIVKVADEGNYNIIMIGRTGKSGLKELILGSVSSRVLHLAEKQTVALVSSSSNSE